MQVIYVCNSYASLTREPYHFWGTIFAPQYRNTVCFVHIDAYGRAVLLMFNKCELRHHLSTLKLNLVPILFNVHFLCQVSSTMLIYDEKDIPTKL